MDQLLNSWSILRFIMVENRAYFKIKSINQLTEDHQKFVIQMKENSEIFRPHSLQRLKQDASTVTGDNTYQLGTEQSRSMKRQRVVFFRTIMAMRCV
ncbi:hypothetical protein ACFY5J_26060 [Peribacillus butanolivorans]|uniref:hypothetical protein n=1 Tax=Peribacillus butanolivorans TaxID=421767 RepID=UPI00366E6FBF